MASIFEECFIRRSGFKNIMAGNVCAGFSVDICLTDPRGSHLSCLENFTVKIDGETVPAGQIVLVLRNREYQLTQIETLAYCYWQINEDMQVRVYNGRSVESLETFEISFDMRVPYAGSLEQPEIASKYEMVTFSGRG